MVGLDSPLQEPGHGRFRWTIIAFALAGLLIAALAVWQLAETTPARWCVLAKQGSPELATGCFGILLKLLEIKDHAVMALLAILGLTILSVVVIALGVNIKASGLGGSLDLGAGDNNKVQAGDAVISGPPPEGQPS